MIRVFSEISNKMRNLLTDYIKQFKTNITRKNNVLWEGAETLLYSVHLRNVVITCTSYEYLFERFTIVAAYEIFGTVDVKVLCRFSKVRVFVHLKKIVSVSLH
jgi:hypothetical protein